MITLRTSLAVLPAKQKEVLLTLLALLQQSKKEEECLSYAIFSDIEDKNIFNLISEWDTRETLDKYMGSDRFSILLGTKSLLSEPLKIQIITGTDSEGIEMFHELSGKICVDR
jgi:quinol monooxygenase YgiN